MTKKDFLKRVMNGENKPENSLFVALMERMEPIDRQARVIYRRWEALYLYGADTLDACDKAYTRIKENGE